MPIWIATSSEDAQYLPSKYSRTNTGTFAPTFTLRTRSFRTTLPANSRFTLSSRASRVGTGVLVMGLSHSKTNRDVGWRPVQLRIAGGVLHHEAYCRDSLCIQQHGESSGLSGFKAHGTSRAVELGVNGHPRGADLPRSLHQHRSNRYRCSEETLLWELQGHAENA